MNIQFLGTGAGLPSKFRNTQSFVFNFMQELRECWMFDCGEATQHQILKTNIRPTKITKIFISHMHADHVLGLIGFLTSRSFLLNKGDNKLTIYGPVGIKDYIEYNLKATSATLTYEVDYMEFSEEVELINNANVQVKAFPLKHHLQSYGYEIKFKEQAGSLKVDELQKLGIAPGPFYRQIKEQETFEYEGEIYQSKDYMEQPKKEKKIVIVPDTKYFEMLNTYLEDVDTLIIECTYLDKKDAPLAKKHTHLSLEDIEKLIVKNAPKNLYLTHISARYTKEEELVAKKVLEQYTKTIVAKDLGEYNI